MKMGKYKSVRVGRVIKAEHQLVWEAANGPVPKGYDIHHINGNHRDNRIENLEILTRSEHLKLHAKLRRQNIDIIDSSDPDVIKERQRQRMFAKEHKEQLSKKRKEHYLAHKEEYSKRNAKYREEHKEEIRDKKKAYYDEHREEINAKHKNYYSSHKSKIIAYQKKYFRENKEKVAAKKKAYAEKNKARFSTYNKLLYAIRSGKPPEVIDRLQKEYSSFLSKN